MFLGANWYALIASVGLAALFILHIIYAVWLTIQNRKARGTDRYAVTSRPPQVEWASKNMLVLGIVILAFLVVHLIQFWAKMQWMEIIHDHANVEGVPAAAEFGTLFIQAAFSEVYTPIVYIIGFVALWLHMNHGFWSMFQSAGWNNQTWLPRLKCIGCWWTSIVVALFIAQAIVFTVKAHNQDFIKDPKLQEQYAEYYGTHGMAAIEDAQGQLMKAQAAGQNMETVYPEITKELVKTLAPIAAAADKFCADAKTPELDNVINVYNQIKSQFPEETPAAAPVIEEDETEIVVANPE